MLICTKITDGQPRAQKFIIDGPEFFLVIHIACFEVKSKLKDWNAKLDDVLQRMLTVGILKTEDPFAPIVTQFS